MGGFWSTADDRALSNAKAAGKFVGNGLKSIGKSLAIGAASNYTKRGLNKISQSTSSVYRSAKNAAGRTINKMKGKSNIKLSNNQKIKESITNPISVNNESQRVKLNARQGFSQGANVNQSAIRDANARQRTNVNQNAIQSENANQGAKSKKNITISGGFRKKTKSKKE